jgi:hypothetical protein
MFLATRMVLPYAWLGRALLHRDKRKPGILTLRRWAVKFTLRTLVTTKWSKFIRHPSAARLQWDRLRRTEPEIIVPRLEMMA